MRPQSPASHPSARPSNLRVDEVLQDYFDGLRKKSERLPVARIDPQNSLANTFHLPDIYEELYTEPMRLGNSAESKAHKLIDAIASPEYRFTALRGGVGSGKSAFLNHLGCCLSGGGGTSPALKDSIPVVVALGGSLETIQTYAQKSLAGLAWALVERAFSHAAGADT